MIKRKKKDCKECGKPSLIFSKGLCEFCASKDSKGLNSNKEIKSSFKPIKRITQRRIEEKRATSEKREVYFDYHIKRCSYSEESNKFIADPNRANICHLFDKSRHPSLEDNLSNYVYLSFKEHERFDKLLYSHEFHKIEKEFKNSWDIVCNRLLNLLSLCTENTVFTRNIKSYLDERGIKS